LRFIELLLAVQFLTRIPITIRTSVEEKNLARSMAFFPLVGVLLGALAAGCHVLVSSFLGRPAGDLLILIFLVAITGNLHGDGLMDTADALFSGRSREEILEIMKDSRVGSHGATAGSLVLLTKFVFLGQLSEKEVVLGLILMMALGRWALVYGAALYPYVRKGKGAGHFTVHVGFHELFWASATALGFLVALLGVKGMFLAGGVFAGVASLGWFISQKIGGMTGDTLGPLNECAEVLTLLILQVLF